MPIRKGSLLTEHLHTVNGRIVSATPSFDRSMRTDSTRHLQVFPIHCIPSAQLSFPQFPGSIVFASIDGRLPFPDRTKLGGLDTRQEICFLNGSDNVQFVPGCASQYSEHAGHPEGLILRRDHNSQVVVRNQRWVRRQLTYSVRSHLKGRYRAEVGNTRTIPVYGQPLPHLLVAVQQDIVGDHALKLDPEYTRYVVETQEYSHKKLSKSSVRTVAREPQVAQDRLYPLLSAGFLYLSLSQRELNSELRANVQRNFFLRTGFNSLQSIEVWKIMKNTILALCGLVIAFALVAPPKANAQVAIGIGVGRPVYGYVAPRAYVYAPAPYAAYAPDYVYPYGYAYAPYVYPSVVIGGGWYGGGYGYGRGYGWRGGGGYGYAGRGGYGGHAYSGRGGGGGGRRR